MSKTRRHFAATEKVAILRRHLIDKVPVSDLCDQLKLNPTVFYRWQRDLFENGAAAFERSPGRSKVSSSQERKIAQLEDKLQRKNEVLSELMEEHVQLKRELGEP